MSVLKPVNFSVLMPLVDEIVNGTVDNTPVEIGKVPEREQGGRRG